MSMTSGPINETEQAGEKLTDHALPQIIAIVREIFACLWRTRITIDIEERK
jgi:hypothetical protein